MSSRKGGSAKTKQPNVKWSSEEDESLISLFQENGKSWAVIASRLIGGRRSRSQCRFRWRTIYPSKSKGIWSSEEDESLSSLVQEHGTSSWSLIASKLVGG